ncbi:hypothetical protein GALMADRAFT_136861 [Galerina marginata CBS 339.88]|uniref:Uncharacterized protein n=1 Tax=Galerina marginata (strain CBS 339.88) TaxID=685588 RepID=A0A067TB48_GALM3|nr:hypothetical protein GALMADRAFT_136861 [Galerina marginata CBS 339.88]
MSSNKLKKPPMSATLALATSNSNSFQQSYYATPKTHIDMMQPLTATEQYWATRALKAEALLAAQETHQKEVRTLGHAQDMKRERELGLLAKEHKEKHAALEKLLMLLAILVAMLVVVIIYLSTHYTRHSMLLHQKQQGGWWSTIGASHFTIPILSPFTSVVEQETSVVGTRLIGTLAAITACLAFLAFRHWTTTKSKPSNSLVANITTAASGVQHTIDR